MIDLIAHFAWSVRAMAPEATGVAALVPTKLVTQTSSAPVVAYIHRNRFKIIHVPIPLIRTP